jgi:hypothetical protein
MFEHSLSILDGCLCWPGGLLNIVWALSGPLLINALRPSWCISQPEVWTSCAKNWNQIVNFFLGWTFIQLGSKLRQGLIFDNVPTRLVQVSKFEPNDLFCPLPPQIGTQLHGRGNPSKHRREPKLNPRCIHLFLEPQQSRTIRRRDSAA